MVKKNTSKSGTLILLIAAVFIAVIVVHWPALSAKALSFDDNQYLTDNALVQNPSLASTWRFSTEVLKPSTVAGYYQPLTMISLMADYSIGGRPNNVMPFHRTSLALHAANTALIIVLLYMLFGSPWIAAAVGLLFGLHPLTVEPIPWIGERKTLLAAFFALWSIIFYVRYVQKSGSWKRYTGCFIFYFLALLSKPTSIPLPILMLLMDFWPLNRLSSPCSSVSSVRVRQCLLEKIPFFVLGCISAVITYISQSRACGVVTPSQGGVERIFLILCHNIVFYIYKILWPINLSSHYPFPEPLNLSQPAIQAGLIGTCILIALLLISLKWTKAAFIGWLFFFIAILPTMQIVGFNDVIASDKYAYLPSLGLLMMLAAFLKWLCFNSSIATSITRYVMVSMVVLVLVCSGAAATRGYLAYWRDSVILYQHMISLAPKSVLVYNNLGLAYGSLGRYQDALDTYKQAISMAPDYADAYSNMGIAYGKLGRYQDAIQAYKQAIKIKSNHVEAYYNLGNAYSNLGRYQEALETYKQVIKIKPDYIGAQHNLGTTYLNLGRYRDAIEAYQQALKIKPDYALSHYALGGVYLAIGDKNSALKECETLKHLDAQKADKLFALIRSNAH